MAQKLLLSLLLVLFSAGSAQAISEELVEDIYIKYGVTVVIFSDYTDKNYEWLFAINKAIDLLSGSSEILEKTIRNDGKALKFFLTEDPGDWGSGSYDAEEHSITINTTPKLVDFFGGGHMGENGFLRATKLYVVMHELGHAYDFSNGRKPAMSLYSSLIRRDVNIKEKNGIWNFTEYLLEMPPTKYPFLFCDDNFNLTEDFADSFVLYILWPSVLKHNFTKRYAFLKNIFRKEFRDSGIMQSALKARLFKKNEEIKCIYRGSLE